MGCVRIQTYILDEETGVSLKASGWMNEGLAGGGQWKHTDGKPRRIDQPTGVKQRWALQLNPERLDVVVPQRDLGWEQQDIFEVTA